MLYIYIYISESQNIYHTRSEEKIFIICMPNSQDAKSGHLRPKNCARVLFGGVDILGAASESGQQDPAPMAK